MEAGQNLTGVVLLCLTAVVLAFMLGHAVASRPRPGTYTVSARAGDEIVLPEYIEASGTPSTEITFPISLNEAGAEQLACLPGIGSALALRIIQYRDAYGKFNRLEELLEVPGIGQKKLDDIRDLITL